MKTRRRRTRTTATTSALTAAGALLLTLTGTAGAATAAPGFQPVQTSPSLPAVPRDDIDWTIADPAFDYNAATGQPGAAFTPLADEAGATRTRVLTGIDHGASYRIEVPLTGWNGDVVFWEHGYRGTGTTLYVDSPSYDLRKTYTDAGYAWAASSYSANRYDIYAAMLSTERLAARFDQLVGPADDRFLQGVSMGGHVIGGLIERKRVPWSGAAPMCGVMGDLAQFDIPLSYNLVGQALAEVDGFPVQSTEQYRTEVVPAIKSRLGLPTSPVGPNPELTKRGKVFRDVVVQLTGGKRPGAANAFTYWEGQSFTFGRFADDPSGTLGAVTAGRVSQNADTLYPTSFTFPDGDTLNERVERVAAAPGTRRAPSPITQLHATFDVPVLSVHTLGDLFVPFEHERIYAAEAQRQGTGGLLVQRVVRSAGHCEFTPQEAAETFTDLTTWVASREGSGREARPYGADVLNPSAVARPDFGCRTTSTGAGGTRGLFAPCPTPAAG